MSELVRGIRLGLLLLVAALPAVAEEWRLVRFTFQGPLEALPGLVAVERGLLVQEQLAASTLAAPSTEALLQTMTSGTSHLASVNQAQLLALADARAPVTVVAMAGWDVETALVAAADTVRDVADLRGRRVAVEAGSDALAVLVRLLNNAGLRTDEVAVRSLPADEVAAALARGEIAAAVVDGPLVDRLRASGAAVVLDHARIVDKLGLIGARALVAHDTLLTEDQELLARFVRAWVKGLVYIHQEPDDVAGLLQIHLHRRGVVIDRAEAERWLRSIRYDRHDWSTRDVEDLALHGWALAEIGVLQQAPDLRGYVNTGLASQIWDMLRTGGTTGARSTAP